MEHIVCIEDAGERRHIAREVLLALPEWFGIPESTEEYIAERGGQPFWAALGPDGRAAGFIALKATSEHTCEVAVMGVLRPRQGRGLGRSLMDAALRWAAGRGFEYAQVKTVQRGRCAEYDATNAFYRRLGFRELEVFPTLWDKANPCQIYVKYIGGGA